MPWGAARGTLLDVLDREALRQEALRVHARYVLEIVEGLGFCPWASAARRAGKVRAEVLFGAEPELDATLRAVDALAADPAVEIGLLLYPELRLGRIEFQHFAARVRERHPRIARESGADPEGFAIADFHPDAGADLESGARLVPFIRRSPDPSLQLVRHGVLDAARRGAGMGAGTRFLDADLLRSLSVEALAAGGPPLHDRIAEANLATVRRLGVEEVAQRMDAILLDRDRAYARLGLAPPPFRPASGRLAFPGNRSK